MQFPMQRIEDEMPPCENLVELFKLATQQYGSQKAAAKAMGVSDSAVSRILQGGTHFPKAKSLNLLAQFKSQVDGRPWTVRQLMAWLWELPSEELPPKPTEIAQIRSLFEDGIALLESGISTIAIADGRLQNLGNQASQVDDMCSSLVQILLSALRQNSLDLSKDRDYKKLCKMLDATPEDVAASRLRRVVLGKETAVTGDRMIIAAALKALGDTTPAYELALTCQDC